MKSLKKAYDLSALGGTIMIISKGTIGRVESWLGQRITKSLRRRTRNRLRQKDQHRGRGNNPGSWYNDATNLYIHTANGLFRPLPRSSPSSTESTSGPIPPTRKWSST